MKDKKYPAALKQLHPFSGKHAGGKFRGSFPQNHFIPVRFAWAIVSQTSHSPLSLNVLRGKTSLMTLKHSTKVFVYVSLPEDSTPEQKQGGEAGQHLAFKCQRPKETPRFPASHTQLFVVPSARIPPDPSAPPPPPVSVLPSLWFP